MDWKKCSYVPCIGSMHVTITRPECLMLSLASAAGIARLTNRNLRNPAHARDPAAYSACALILAESPTRSPEDLLPQDERRRPATSHDPDIVPSAEVFIRTEAKRRTTVCAVWLTSGWLTDNMSTVGRRFASTRRIGKAAPCSPWSSALFLRANQKCNEPHDRSPGAG